MAKIRCKKVYQLQKYLGDLRFVWFKIREELLYAISEH